MGIEFNPNNGILKITGTDKNDCVNITKHFKDIDSEKVNELDLEISLNKETFTINSEKVKKIEIETLGGDDSVHMGGERYSYKPGASISNFRFFDAKDEIDKGVEIEIKAGDGNDEIQIYDNKKNVTVDGGAGNDKILTSKGNDKIIGGEGNDKIQTKEGNDKIIGGPGNDEIDAGDGNDDIRGGDGEDILIGGPGDDKIRTGKGKDKFFENEPPVSNFQYSTQQTGHITSSFENSTQLIGRNFNLKPAASSAANIYAEVKVYDEAKQLSMDINQFKLTKYIEPGKDEIKGYKESAKVIKERNERLDQLVKKDIMDLFN
jgi:Ca2+-binding RTX toxin-like protein